MPVDNSGTPECHFTYAPGTSEHLQQGDILAKTPEMLALLAEVHPHYLQEDYTHFLVLTQSCDLVRRDGKHCKSRYITLAAIRPLSLVMERELEGMQDDFMRTAKVCSIRHRDKLKMFLERLLNNNEPGYFYLHEDVAFDFPESSCAILPLSISIRASQHYELCLQARRLSLQETFQAKLGWLVGNMYSRVGTEDWVPTNVTDAEFQKLIQDLLDSSCQFFEEEQIKTAQKTVTPEVQADYHALRQHIQASKVKSRKERAIERVIQILQEGAVVDAKQSHVIRRKLQNDPELSQLLPK